MEFLVVIVAMLLVTVCCLGSGLRTRNRPARALLFALAGLCVAFMVLVTLNIENSGGGTEVPPKSPLRLQ